MGKEFRLDRDFDEGIASKKTAEQSDAFRDFWIVQQKSAKQQNIKEEKRTMGKVLMIGAGGCVQDCSERGCVY